MPASGLLIFCHSETKLTTFSCHSVGLWLMCHDFKTHNQVVFLSSGRYECVCVCLHHIRPMVTVVVCFFCWLIPASPHACLTTQSSSLLASCPNQFICKQVCFFPLRPIVHTTPECTHNGRPLSLPALLLYCSYYDTHTHIRKLHAC